MAVSTNPLVTGIPPFTYTASSITIPSGSQLLAPDGTAAAPSYSFSGATGHGIFRSTDILGFSIGGAKRGSFDSSGSAHRFTLDDDVELCWANADQAAGNNVDVKLVRGAAGVLEQKNGANAQAFRVYGTTTGSKYISVSHDGTISIVTDSGGSGIRLGSSGGNIGFYGTTPVALQTGVAVSAAGIHAALVNLGLITA